MKKNEKAEYITYRIEKAEETLLAAVQLAQGRFWNSCVNRLYYACFYAVTAMLVNEQIITKTHVGVKTQFFQHFIKTGIIDTKFSMLYSDLFDWRQKGDYNDFFDLTESDVLPLFEQVREFLKISKQLLF